MKKKKEDYELQLENIGSIREMQMKESEISGKISGLEKKIQYAEIEKVTTNLSGLIDLTCCCQGNPDWDKNAIQ